MSQIEVINKSAGSYRLTNLDFCSTVGFISVLKLFSNFLLSSMSMFQHI